MSLTRSRTMPGDLRRRGAWPALRGALAGAAVLALGGSSAFAQTEGEAPASEAAPATPAPAATAGPRDGNVLQDWTLRCQLREPDQEICEMRQRIVDQNGNRVVLAVVGRLPNIDVPGLLILLPLGIALPPGAFLQIDQGEEQRVQIERCESQGCRIELLLDDDLLPLLKAGSRATIGFHVYDGQGERPRVDVPISLIGFSAALAEVMQ